MSVLGDLVGQFLGEAAVEAFSRNKNTRVPFRENGVNASLSAMTSFSGVLAFLFSLLLLLWTFVRAGRADAGAWLLPILTVVVLLLSWWSLRAGMRAPLVTQRRLGLARFGVWVSTLALAISGTTLILWLVRAVK
jgi:hypothetical protein